MKSDEEKQKESDRLVRKRWEREVCSKWGNTPHVIKWAREADSQTLLNDIYDKESPYKPPSKPEKEEPGTEDKPLVVGAPEVAELTDTNEDQRVAWRAYAAATLRTSVEGSPKFTIGRACQLADAMLEEERKRFDASWAEVVMRDEERKEKEGD